MLVDLRRRVAMRLLPEDERPSALYARELRLANRRLRRALWEARAGQSRWGRREIDRALTPNP